MDKKEFMRLTGKSVTQTRKLCDKGKFLVDGFGWFEAVRGEKKTSKVDIRALKECASPLGWTTFIKRLV